MKDSRDIKNRSGQGRPSQEEVSQRPPPEPAERVIVREVEKTERLTCPYAGCRASALHFTHKADAKRRYFSCSRCKRPFFLDLEKQEVQALRPE